MAMATEEIALAVMIRPRCGTRVNVVSPVRWLHSLVTARIAIKGRMMTTGKRIAVAKVEYVRLSSGAHRITPAVASTEVIAMLAINQNPERVLNIFRNSTAVIRARGIGFTVVAGTRTSAAAMAVMPVLLLVGWRR